MQHLQPLDVQAVQDALRAFADDRQWQQFHSPKNLVMALTGEVGELSELFQWRTPEQSEQIMSDPDTAEAVRDELADVLTYVLRLADVLSVDLHQAVWRKISKNGEKYPVDKARGSAKKYTELRDD